MQNLNILVTGAGGFLGSWLAERLEQEGHSVTWLSLQKTSLMEHAKGSIVIANLCTADLEPIVARQDCIFHLAAMASLQQSIEHPDAAMQNNAESTHRLLEAAQKTNHTGRKTLRFVLMSSERVYGNSTTTRVNEESPVHPVEVYSESKRRAEQYCRQYAEHGAVNYTIIRSSSIFGPRQSDAAFIPACIRRILEAHKKGERQIAVGNIQHFRNFLYVEDFLDAMLTILTTPASQNQILNIGGKNVAVASVLEELFAIAAARLHFTPVRVATAELQRSKSIELPRFELDCSKAERLLNWHPKHTLRQGLEKTFAYYQLRG